MSPGRDTDLRAVRERLGLSQAGLARALGVSRRSVGRWEAAGAKPRNAGILGRVELLLEIDALYTETGADIGDFWEVPMITLALRTPREALADGALERVRAVLVKALEGDFT